MAVYGMSGQGQPPHAAGLTPADPSPAAADPAAGNPSPAAADPAAANPSPAAADPAAADPSPAVNAVYGQPSELLSTRISVPLPSSLTRNDVCTRVLDVLLANKHVGDLSHGLDVGKILSDRSLKAWKYDSSSERMTTRVVVAQVCKAEGKQAGALASKRKPQKRTNCKARFHVIMTCAVTVSKTRQPTGYITNNHPTLRTGRGSKTRVGVIVTCKEFLKHTTIAGTTRRVLDTEEKHQLLDDLKLSYASNVLVQLKLDDPADRTWQVSGINLVHNHEVVVPLATSATAAQVQHEQHADELRTQTIHLAASEAMSLSPQFLSMFGGDGVSWSKTMAKVKKLGRESATLTIFMLYYRGCDAATQTRLNERLASAVSRNVRRAGVPDSKGKFSGPTAEDEVLTAFGVIDVSDQHNEVVMKTLLRGLKAVHQDRALEHLSRHTQREHELLIHDEYTEDGVVEFVVLSDTALMKIMGQFPDNLFCDTTFKLDATNSNVMTICVMDSFGHPQLVSVAYMRSDTIESHKKVFRVVKSWFHLVNGQPPVIEDEHGVRCVPQVRVLHIDGTAATEPAAKQVLNRLIRLFSCLWPRRRTWRNNLTEFGLGQYTDEILKFYEMLSKYADTPAKFNSVMERLRTLLAEIDTVECLVTQRDYTIDGETLAAGKYVYVDVTHAQNMRGNRSVYVAEGVTGFIVMDSGRRILYLLPRVIAVPGGKGKGKCLYVKAALCPNMDVNGRFWAYLVRHQFGPEPEYKVARTWCAVYTARLRSFGHTTTNACETIHGLIKLLSGLTSQSGKAQLRGQSCNQVSLVSSIVFVLRVAVRQASKLFTDAEAALTAGTTPWPVDPERMLDVAADVRSCAEQKRVRAFWKCNTGPIGRLTKDELASYRAACGNAVSAQRTLLSAAYDVAVSEVALWLHHAEYNVDLSFWMMVFNAQTMQDVASLGALVAYGQEDVREAAVARARVIAYVGAAEQLVRVQIAKLVADAVYEVETNLTPRAAKVGRQQIIESVFYITVSRHRRSDGSVACIVRRPTTPVAEVRVVVLTGDSITCSCFHDVRMGQPCRHIYAVRRLVSLERAGMDDVLSPILALSDLDQSLTIKHAACGRVVYATATGGRRVLQPGADDGGSAVVDPLVHQGADDPGSQHGAGNAPSASGSEDDLINTARRVVDVFLQRNPDCNLYDSVVANLNSDLGDDESDDFVTETATESDSETESQDEQAQDDSPQEPEHEMMEDAVQIDQPEDQLYHEPEVDTDDDESLFFFDQHDNPFDHPFIDPDDDTREEGDPGDKEDDVPDDDPDDYMVDGDGAGESAHSNSYHDATQNGSSYTRNISNVYMDVTGSTRFVDQQQALAYAREMELVLKRANSIAEKMQALPRLVVPTERSRPRPHYLDRGGGRRRRSKQPRLR